MCEVRGGHMHVWAYSEPGTVPDSAETKVSKETKINPQGADVLEHRKTLNKIDKMHCVLYVDTYRKRGKGCQGIRAKDSII